MNPEDRDVVLSGLRAYNLEHTSVPGFAPLNLLVRDDEGRIRGGLLGETGWEWLHVQILWLDETLRRQGVGSQLLATAEAEARERGCQGAYLDTFDFQALPFYQRHGYEVFGVLENYPPGSRRHFLRKTLLPVT